tara:strand:+ start:469 stop:1011 length:543 start_codon:yes stop_codon:yes gene_type:complete
MTPEKLRLLKNLDQEIYVSFGLSEIHGIGVVAIKDIPEGIDPFAKPYRPGFPEKIVDLYDEEVEALPREVSSKIKDLFIKTDGSYPVYWAGLNGVDVRFYMNHSEEDPNVELNYNFGVAAGGRVRMGTVYCPFKASREIKKGEELTWDYRTSEGADDIWKQFPFIKKEGILKRAWKKLSK